VCSRELIELWVGGKALILILLFCLVQGGIAYSLLGDVDPTPREEMLYLTVKMAMAVGVFMSVIFGADSISGERERGTLEALLLTPVSRRQIVIGKFLAASSPWPAALAVSIPYLAVLSDGVDIFVQSLTWGAILGAISATAFAGLGTIISFWSNSNKNRFLVSLVIYLVFQIPTFFPWEAQLGTVGRLARRLNPLEANSHILDKVITVHWPLGAYWLWLTSPVVFAILVYVVLVWYASPGLSLEGGNMPRFWSYLGRLWLFKKRSQLS